MSRTGLLSQDRRAVIDAVLRSDFCSFVQGVFPRSLRRRLLMRTSSRSRLASPRWTYGRESNRMLPRGQRIRAKQQTVTPLLHRPKTREHLRRCSRFRGCRPGNADERADGAD